MLLLTYQQKNVFVPSQTKDINVKVFNMLTRVNEAEVKHVSCECKCKFGSTVCNSRQKWNNNKCQVSYVQKRL